MTFSPDDWRRKVMEANVAKQARQALKDDSTGRKAAEHNDKFKPVFLRPNDIDGEYDFKRMLKTTLGGLELRNITLQDLEAFGSNIETIGTLYKGGITIPQVISLSRQDDIDRANREILSVAPKFRRAGTVTFLTNSGPRSKDPFHVVNIEFMAYDSVVLQPVKERASTIKNRLSNGKVRIECDCGRFRYWYRYIATLGNYVHGRRETGFPKEKNPDLTGIACKHILRVAQYCRSALGQQYLKMAIDKDRAKTYGRMYSSSPKQLAKMIDDQAALQGKASHKITPRLNTEAKKIATRVEKQTKQVMAKQAKLDNKERRIARLTANFNSGLIDKADYDFYMRVERERKY
ncbi:hypothetical protein [Acinetobacter chengduensis]|uniref:SWIM-type domain-containing protein n=1 Tax=Acinetobacter chengduensis TaxID=2420890 RepID=A0ABX9TSK4_9GAMM|nr:hypothetical protein [Acinetobacter chengduensis]RLL18999.1 hypothetical protein D9K81_14680 [Acinetobacter chengduensis]